MVKIGDKVRFLNAVGGGVVRTIDQRKNLAMVEEDDGFETPVLLHECVVVEAGDERLSAGGTIPEKGRLNNRTRMAPERLEPEEEPVRKPVFETPEGERLNVWLGFVPEDSRSLQNTRFEAYLVNDSNYFLLFTVSSKSELGWGVRYAGKVDPNIKLHIETFGKEQLNEWEQLCVQFVAFKRDKPFAQKGAVSVEQRIDPVKFYKLHSFRENDYFEEDALLVPIVRNDVPERPIRISPAELQQAMKMKQSVDSPKGQPMVKKTQQPGRLIEIDLHIHELLDSTAGMSNGDILDYQLAKFNEVLTEHRLQKGLKIVFIHGKGDGVLRNAILKELRAKYKHYSYQDASFREYGFGATMVTIR